MKNKKSPRKMSSAKKKKQLRTIFVSLIAVACCLLGVFLAVTVNKIIANKSDSDMPLPDEDNSISSIVHLDLDAIIEELEDDGNDEERVVGIYLYRPYEADENGDGSQYFIDDNKRIFATISESEGLLSQGWYQYECVYVKYYDASLDNMVVEILPVDRFDSTKHTAITEKEYKEFLANGGDDESDVVVKTNCTYCGSDEHTTDEHVCKRCDETGHSEKTCTVKICLLCDAKGHTAEEHECDRCGGTGHLKENCPVPSCSICGTVGHSNAEHPCTKCGDKGHDASACIVKICRLCYAKGHTAEEHKCDRCDGKGHLKENCPVPSCSICDKIGHSDDEHFCTKCERYGHDASTCQDKCTICKQTGHKKEGHICEKCGVMGHAEKDCTTKICTICKGLGNDGVGHLYTEHLCTKCNGYGHDASACTVKICEICKEKGHIASEHLCTKCGGKGHDAPTCQDKCTICKQTGHKKEGHICEKCGVMGHAEKDCTTKICTICKGLGNDGVGHLYTEHLCTKCGGKGHDASACTKKKCSSCGNLFDTQTALDKHVAEKHTNCEDCGKTGHMSGTCCSICGNGTTQHDDSGHRCENCGDLGHGKDTCNVKKCSSCKETFISQSALDKHVAEKHTKCADCGKTGHVSETCCSICGNGTTAHDDSGHKCTNCGEYGHDTAVCAVGICVICYERGHVAEECPKSMIQKCGICGEDHATEKHECSVCHSPGHRSEDCPNNYRQVSITCRYCGRVVSSEAELNKHIANNHACGLCGEEGHTSDEHLCDKCGDKGHLYEHCHGCTMCGNPYHTAENCGAPYCEFCALFRERDNNTHNTEQHACSSCGGIGHEQKVDPSSCPQPRKPEI